NMLKLRHHARSSRRAALLERTVRSPAGFLAALLVGNNLANSLAVNSAMAFSVAQLGAQEATASLWVTAALTPLVFVVGEIGPKQFMLAAPHPRMLAAAPALSLLRFVLTPLTAPLVLLQRIVDRGSPGGIARHQLQTLLLEGRHARGGEAPVLGAALRALEAKGRGLRPFLRGDLPAIPAQAGLDAVRRVLAGSPDGCGLLERPGGAPALIQAARLVHVRAHAAPSGVAEDLPMLPPETELAEALVRLNRLGKAYALVGRPGVLDGVLDLEFLLARLLAPQPLERD
ncbi:MAG TPA: DUF21 domain-containing protein, partial [Planctomycetota bacterium]